MKPPLIEQCKAHLECAVESVHRLGEDVVVFGRILAASIDRDCLAAPLGEQYLRLRPIFFLEDGVYGSLDCANERGTARPRSDR